MRMELALPERFDTRQALRYLGISTEEPDSATRALLRRAERTLRAAAGRAQWRCAQRGMIFLLICRETISCGIWKGAGAVCSWHVHWAPE